MNLRFPAVIKRIEAAESGILATFDISPPNLTALTDLIDREILLSISISDDSTAPVVAREKARPAPNESLLFDPDEEDLSESPAPRAVAEPGHPRRRPAARPKNPRP